MAEFKVVSEYSPAGDQPQAIAALAEGVEQGLREQVLMGVTGSGKTYTMAKVIEAVQSGTLSEEAIDTACRRVLIWKQALGLI